MRIVIYALFSLASLLYWAGMALPAAAQRQPNKPVFDNLVTPATLQGIRGNLCQVMVVNQPWLLQIDPKVKVEITGTAEPDYLALMQPPLMVRFKAEVNTKTKQATAAVTEMEILNPTEKIKAGAVVEESNTFDDPKKGTQPATINYEVTGPVSGYKNGQMVVMGLKVAVDPAAKITVKITEPKMLLMLPAGTVMTADFDYLTMTQGKGILKEAKVALTEPLAPPKKPMPNAGKKGSDPKPPANKGKTKADEAKEDAPAKAAESEK